MGLKETIERLEKAYGKGTIIQLGEGPPIPVEVISTDIYSLDSALGIGGLPRGRIVELFGPEASGKTTLSLHCIAAAQSTGGKVAYIDAEHAFDPKYASAIGVQTKDLYLNQPDYGEQALQIVEGLVKSGEIDMIVVDSVAALVPKAELDGEIGDTLPGLQARMMSQALRKLTGEVSTSRTILLFINQLREKIGVMFGNPEVTTGGRALKFYASIRLDVRKIGTLKDGEKPIGSRTRIKIVKSKVAAPFNEVELDLFYGKGFSKETDLLEAGVREGVIERAGAWLSFDREKIGQGRDAARKFLVEHQDTKDNILAKLKEKHEA